MSFPSDWFLAFRNFFVYKQGSLSLKRMVRAVLGIGFSMIPLILVLEVSSGMIEGITRRYVEVGSFHYQVRPYGGETADSAGVSKKIQALPGVSLVTPLVEGQGLVYSSGGRTGVQVRGLTSEDFNKDEGLRTYLSLVEGDFSFGDDRRGIVLSQPIAEKLKVGVGDSVKLLVSRISAISGKPVLRPGTYLVKGIFTTGYRELDALSVYLHYDRASRLFRDEGSYILGIKVEDYVTNVDARKQFFRSHLPPGWYVLSWYDLNRSLYQNLSSTKTMLLLIMTLIIIVAAVNISSTILNLVMERQEQIAVLKSMGGRPSHIERQFLMTGFFLGLAGVSLGMVVGLLVAVNVNEAIAFIEFLVNGGEIFLARLFPFLSYEGDFTLLNPGYYLEKIPVRIPLAETFFVGFLTLALCTVAAVFPARRAGKIKPLEILRKH